MTQSHWYVLVVYLIFTAIATLLALARRWFRPNATGESVWRKYPTYIVINLTFLAAGWLPHEWHVLTILLAALGGLASWEIAHTLTAWKGLPALTALLIVAADWVEIDSLISLWLIVILSCTVMSALTSQTDQLGRQMLSLAGGLGYVPICLVAFVWIWKTDPDGFLTAFLYLVIATNDALAQITGQLLGQRQLAPRLSPAKTVEGAVGGILFASGIGSALSPIIGLGYVTGGLLGLGLGLAGLGGDLTASAWKRALSLKNFSGLMGPQGGVLDRFDGLFFAAPVFYLFVVYVRGVYF
jgi:CDP-diglyceride synthetase